jgi:glycosyltransferase involved in cell wall biosynthesis
MTRIAAVFWSGTVGGAETFTASLCRTIADLGAEPGVVFVTGGEPMASRLDDAGIPHMSLGLGRGRDVIRHPRALATAVRRLGPDGALLPTGGYLAAALRLGGYRSRIVAVIHNAAQFTPMTTYERLVRPLDRAVGFWASDIDVAVSDFVLTRIRDEPRRGRLIRIYNGVDLDAYTDAPERSHDEHVVIGFAGRLIDGKGADVLLRAVAAGSTREGVRLRIAGDGPTRADLQALASSLGLGGVAEFSGWHADMSAFWRACDIAAMPSDRFVESFGMAAVEAMACARPVIVTANGALPELVEGGAGQVVPAGDVAALAEALTTLTHDVDARRAFGRAARARAEERFDIRDCAASYLRLFQDGRASNA